MGGPVTKIATCCYCGTRAALVLRGKDRHELACASCGAPLHRLKMLKLAEPRPDPVPARPIRPARPDRPVRRPRKRRGLRHVMHEIAEFFDDLEDLFD
ncbi:hypothetical protein [Actibacterium ureilyticum]|uniref:hypothetical protein n=1 Tax=Actibacterium ureilyticum TaxID=1590614 RepID=UPI000BAAF03D|nr:hypothetical protein [Actibacterium ureilyticum]